MIQYRRLCALLLALSLMLSLTGCAGKKPASASEPTPAPAVASTAEPAPEPTPEPAPAPASSLTDAVTAFSGKASGSQSGGSAEAEEPAPPAASGPAVLPEYAPNPNPYFDNGTVFPDYVHYDPADFYAGCDRLEELYAAGDAEAAGTLYDSLLDELLLMCDYRGVSSLRNTENTSDEYWQTENEYSESLFDEVINTFSELGQRILSGPGGEAFRAHVGEDTARGFEDYDVLDAHQLELLARESALVNEYYEKSELVYTMSVSYQGQEWTYDSIMEYTENPDFDYDLFIGAYQELLRTVNEELGAIYLELVQLRTEYAQSLGYDNYIAMADEDYGRDYDISAAEPMKKEAGRLGYYVENYYSYFLENLPAYQVDNVEQMLADVGETLSQVSPLAGQIYADFLAEHAYSIGTEEERLGAGYTSKFYTNSHAYIYHKTSLSAEDLTTMCHEFGHYMDFTLNEDPDVLFSTNALDLDEIHSNGLQMLAGRYLDEKLCTGAEDEMSFDGYNCMELLYQVSQGCLYDDWQREIYANPDMTLDEINALYGELYEKYGYSPYPGAQYEWMQVNHNFDSPLYYFSYAASAYAVLQIYLTSLEDYDAAVAMWESVLAQGAYNVSVEEVFKNAGLSFIDEENETKVIYHCLDTWFYDVEE